MPKAPSEIMGIAKPTQTVGDEDEGKAGVTSADSKKQHFKRQPQDEADGDDTVSSPHVGECAGETTGNRHGKAIGEGMFGKLMAIFSRRRQDLTNSRPVGIYPDNQIS